MNTRGLFHEGRENREKTEKENKVDWKKLKLEAEVQDLLSSTVRKISVGRKKRNKGKIF